MSDPINNAQRARERRLPAGKEGMLPFFVEFVKFATGFAAIVAIVLLALHVASAAMQ